MKRVTQIFASVLAFGFFFAISAQDVQAQWTDCGMPLDFGDYYDDIPTDNPGDINVQTVVSAYPNPNPGTYLNVMVSQLEQPGKLQLFDMSGRMYREMAINATDAGNGEYKLSLEGLSRGTYLVSVTNGSSRITQKVLIR